MSTGEAERRCQGVCACRQRWDQEGDPTMCSAARRRQPAGVRTAKGHPRSSHPPAHCGVPSLPRAHSCAQGSTACYNDPLQWRKTEIARSNRMGPYTKKARGWEGEA